jgi:hypothetical protein
MMRATILRSAILAAVLTATAAASDPVPAPKTLPPLSPDVAKLRADTAALGREHDEAAKEVLPTPAAAERAVLQSQLRELLKRINERPAPAPYPKGPAAKSPFVLPEGTRPLDTLRLAENLFKEGEIDAALRAFRLIDAATLPREDRPFVQYMTATCLRRLNRRSEAAVILREVAGNEDDEFIAKCAVSQLNLIRSTQELEAQLEQLRSRSKTKLKAPPKPRFRPDFGQLLCYKKLKPRWRRPRGWPPRFGHAWNGAIRPTSCAPG